MRRQSIHGHTELMTTASVALLRGINVGGHGKLKMDALRDAVRGLGFGDVSTYIQSGNVIFTSDGPVDTVDFERSLRAALGTDVTVIVRTAGELAQIIRANPFTTADSSGIHVGFMAHAPDPLAVEHLDLLRFAPDEAAIVGAELYLHLPDGIGRAKLPDHVARQLKVPFTVRNWNTVSKLVELTTA